MERLSRIFNLAMDNPEVKANPAREVVHFKGEARRTRYLLPEEEEQLMTVLAGREPHLRFIVFVALHTGMRRGEIFKLCKADVDFHRAEIHVTHTKTDEDRIVPMNETLYAELIAHCASLQSEYLFVLTDAFKPPLNTEADYAIVLVLTSTITSNVSGMIFFLLSPSFKSV